MLAVEQVPHEEISHYGSMAVEPLEDDVFRVLALIEKPKPEEAPSDLGIVGRYVLTPDIFDALRETKPGIGGEIQITDGLALLLKEKPIFACRFQGKRYDTGRPLGLIQASIELALLRPDVAAAAKRLPAVARPELNRPPFTSFISATRRHCFD